MLEWGLTPSSLLARTSGLLAAQIAIRHRHARCRLAWQPHLDNCRDFLARQITGDLTHNTAPRGHLVLLGSGHLNDFNLDFLQREFARITLVDIVHPIEIQIRAHLSKKRIQCVTADISGLHGSQSAATRAKSLEKLRHLLRGADWAVSSCLLSQLPLQTSAYRQAQDEEADTSQITHPLFAAHLRLLHEAPHALLITDTAQRTVKDGDWDSLLDDFPLPRPLAVWIWQIAPPGEHSDFPQRNEERLVEAFVFKQSEA
jgi:hypothetical protein